jgi:hypothetical protein
MLVPGSHLLEVTGTVPGSRTARSPDSVCGGERAVRSRGLRSEGQGHHCAAIAPLKLSASQPPDWVAVPKRRQGRGLHRGLRLCGDGRGDLRRRGGVLGRLLLVAASVTT